MGEKKKTHQGICQQWEGFQCALNTSASRPLMGKFRRRTKARRVAVRPEFVPLTRGGQRGAQFIKSPHPLPAPALLSPGGHGGLRAHRTPGRVCEALCRRHGHAPGTGGALGHSLTMTEHAVCITGVFKAKRLLSFWKTVSRVWVKKALVWEMPVST